MAPHGTCGVGVGETVKDSLDHPEEVIVAGDLKNDPALRRRLRRIRDRKRVELRAVTGQAASSERFEREFAVFDQDEVVENWAQTASSLGNRGLVCPDAVLFAGMAHEDAVVFEGAQGVLLDEWSGFHPFTSWSTCTAANAIELLDEWAPDAVAERIGVLRTHSSRHGPGPLPTETRAFRAAVFDHNRQNEWQGPVRYGWFDAVLARYALDVVGGVDTLAITHLDAVRRVPAWQACRGYRVGLKPGDAELIGERAAVEIVAKLSIPSERSLARQARLAEMLGRAAAVYEECEPAELAVIDRIERLLDRSVDIVSRGPLARDVVARNAAARRVDV